MGIYYKPVNLDKRQQVHPHRVGDGLKLGEWFENRNSATHRTIDRLLADGVWGEEDEIRVVSDAGHSMHLRGKITEREASYDDEWDDADGLTAPASRESPPAQHEELARDISGRKKP